MGLFGESIDDPRTAAVFGLASQLMGAPNVGQGLMAGMGDYVARMQEAKNTEMKRRLQQAQLDEVAAQAEERKANAAKLQAAAAEQLRQRQLLAGLFKPVEGIDANAASGVTGPRPEALQAVGQPKPVNYQWLMAQGVPHETVKALAEAQNYGRQKVARVEEVMGPDGRPIKVQLDEQGNRVGDPMGVWKAPEKIDLGGAVGLYDPTTRKMLDQLRKSVTPDASLSANVSMRGQDMADARQRDANAISRAGKTQEMETNLRKEFEGLPEVKAYKQAYPSYSGILDASKRSTPMADINMVYGLAKLYDPNSVVREGEYATVANSPTIPERIKGWAQYLQGGGKLTPEVKSQIVAEAKSRISTYQAEHDKARSSYEGIAKQYGYDPGRIFQATGDVQSPDMMKRPPLGSFGGARKPLDSYGGASRPPLDAFGGL